jgi:hypothetical protein
MKNLVLKKLTSLCALAILTVGLFSVSTEFFVSNAQAQTYCDESQQGWIASCVVYCQICAIGGSYCGGGSPPDVWNCPAICAAAAGCTPP